MKTKKIAQPRIRQLRESPRRPGLVPVRKSAEKTDVAAASAAGRVLPQDEALVEIGRWLQGLRTYSFTTVTPETHRRVVARPEHREARSIRDIFGWSLPFRESLLPRAALDALERAGALDQEGEWLRSRVRYSTLDELLFVHSAYPTVAADSVFFGPDTYRYAAVVKQVLGTVPAGRVRRLIDVGAGSGAGGIVAARALQQPDAAVVLSDINPLALRYAAVNCALAGIAATTVQGDLLGPIEDEIDLVISNPPYMADPAARTYRDGGGAHGSELSLRIVRESLSRLLPGGELILYTGVAIVDGVDSFLQAVKPLLQQARASYEYRELDPDVFGEELDRSDYAAVERIAAVGLIARLPF